MVFSNITLASISVILTSVNETVNIFHHMLVTLPQTAICYARYVNVLSHCHS